MLNAFELLLPLILIVLISLPLVNVFRGKKSASVAKRRMITHVCFFFAICLEQYSLLLLRHMLRHRMILH